MSDPVTNFEDDDHFDESLILIAGQVLGNLDAAERRRLQDLSIPAIELESYTESLHRVVDRVTFGSHLIQQDQASTDTVDLISLAPDLVDRIRRDAANYLPPLATTQMGSVTIVPSEIPATSNGQQAATNDLPRTAVSSNPLPISEAVSKHSAQPGLVTPEQDRSNRGNWGAAGLVAICVAASIAAACFGFWLGDRRGDSIASADVTTLDRDSIELVVDHGAAEAWLRQHPAALRLDWSVNDATDLTSDSAQNASAGKDLGSIVWDSDSQSGYMRLTALPINDADAEQYQLWIIDPKRDEEPIDGGVFDIVNSGESFIPINAKLGVIEPKGFAVTIEQSGGVVVSDQSRLPLLAMVSN